MRLALLFVILVSVFSLSNCVADPEDPSEENNQELCHSWVDAVLVGPDIAACLCCHGYILEVEDELLKFEEFPADVPEDLTNLEYPDHYPVLVKVKYEFSRKCGDVTYVNVLSIQIK